MNRKAVLLGFGLLVSAACSPPNTPVFIDESRLLRLENVAHFTVSPMPTPPAALGEMEASLPGLPATRIQDMGSGVDTSVNEIEQRQREAILVLQQRLRKVYEAEVRRAKRRADQTLDASRARAYADANDKLWESFNRYAEERSPLVAELALLVGWPDPNPHSKGDPAQLAPIPKATFLRAKALRESLNLLDDQFIEEVRQAFQLAKEATDDEVKKAEQQVEQVRLAMNQKADQEAFRQVRATPKELGLQLSGPSTVVLPAVPTIKVKMLKPPHLPATARVRSLQIGARDPDRRWLIQHDLDIWLHLQRHFLAPRSSAARDATEEFLTWRKNLLAAGH